MIGCLWYQQWFQGKNGSFNSKYLLSNKIYLTGNTIQKLGKINNNKYFFSKIKIITENDDSYHCKKKSLDFFFFLNNKTY